MASRLATFLVLTTLLTASAVSADELADTLLAGSSAIIVATTNATTFVRTIDEPTVAEKAPLVFGLLANIHEKYHVATVDLAAITTPLLNPFSDIEQAEIEANLKAIVLAQKDLSNALVKTQALFVDDGYDQPILWVLEDTVDAVGKYAEQLLPKFLALPSRVMKKQLEYLLGKAIKAYSPAPAPKAALAI